MGNNKLFPKAYNILNFNPRDIELKIDCVYLDGFNRKIKIYNSIVWDGVIFYVGKYIDPITNEIITDPRKNAECKFLKSGMHFLFSEKQWDLIKEVI